MLLCALKAIGCDLALPCNWSTSSATRHYRSKRRSFGEHLPCPVRPCSTATCSSTATTSIPLIHSAACNANVSRVRLSIGVNARNLRPSNNWSDKKSIDHRSFSASPSVTHHTSRKTPVLVHRPVRVRTIVNCVDPFNLLRRFSFSFESLMAQHSGQGIVWQFGPNTMPQSIPFVIHLVMPSHLDPSCPSAWVAPRPSSGCST